MHEKAQELRKCKTKKYFEELRSITVQKNAKTVPKEPRKKQKRKKLRNTKTLIVRIREMQKALK